MTRYAIFSNAITHSQYMEKRRIKTIQLCLQTSYKQRFRSEVPTRNGDVGRF